MHNYMVDLLPFLDQRNLYRQYHRDSMFCAPENAEVIRTRLRLAMCPSAPSREAAPASTFVPSLLFGQSDRRHPLFGPILKQADKKYSTTFEGAVSDYAVPIQIEDGLARGFGYDVPKGSQPGLRSMFPSPLEQGAAVLGPLFKGVSDGGSATLLLRLRPRDIKDGLSSTMAFAEAAGRPQHWSMGKRTRKYEPLVSAWADPWIALRIKGSITPDQQRCVFGCDNDGEIYGFHPGGVNLLFADGHVDFVSADADPRLILGFVTPDQNDNKPR
jgi:prepilin-type processing-associated H-X9-DG protein